jgi:mono/diheme cytochrome c family protein
MLRALIPAVALVVLPAGVSSAPDGAETFKARCAKCHTARSMRAAVAKTPATERAANLDRFLAEHYAPDPAERKLIVEYLVAPRR